MSERSFAKVLGIIPARGGSKRVPGKNLRLLNNKELLAYSIESGLACASLDELILSSDDDAIIACGKKYGVNVPFKRPSELAQDSTPDRPVLQHALSYFEEEHSRYFDLVVLLRPTAPFRTANLISACIEKWRNSDADSVRSMTKVEGVHHPYWMFTKENELARGVVPGKSINEYYQSQLLPPVFRLNGVVDAVSASIIREGESLYGEKMAVLETPEEQSFDIDTEEDLHFAEYLFTK